MQKYRFPVARACVRLEARNYRFSAKGFVEREIAVADRGDAAERIDNEELRGLEPSL